MKPLACLSALALPLALASAASAHATFAESDVVPNQTARLTVRIGHGCGEEATLRVRVRIPDGMIAAQPMVKAGWTLETITGPYDKPHDSFGHPLTEGVKEIVWTGELPAAYYDEFVFRGRVTDTIPTGEMLYIPVVQECATGAERWINIPAAGQDAHSLDHPAPGVMVVPAAEAHGH